MVGVPTVQACLGDFQGSNSDLISLHCLYIAYVMLIWAAPIPTNRWHCSLWP